jgi:hypothetical protein
MMNSRAWLLCFVPLLGCAKSESPAPSASAEATKPSASTSAAPASSAPASSATAVSSSAAAAALAERMGLGKPEASASAPAAPAEPPDLTKELAEKMITHARTGPVRNQVPAVPAAPSDRPTPEEWLTAPIVNTQGGGHPTDCYVHMLRDWIRIDCMGDIIGTEHMEAFGAAGLDHVLKVENGSYATILVRTLPATSPKLRVCFSDHRDSLFVGRPGQGTPVHVALSKGPACDGSAWGAGYVAPSGGSGAGSSSGSGAAKVCTQGTAGRLCCPSRDDQACVIGTLVRWQADTEDMSAYRRAAKSCGCTLD